MIKEVGETTITGRNQISLPAAGIRELGWARGDRLLVEVVGRDMLLLVRRPKDWIAAFSGHMGDVFGDHDDTLRYLDEERRSWERG
jgi:bifunctional DNA-binding transcriptional regulator/antitoxin component of YhaV-PrlF toxin-antitoxin module